MGIKAIFFDLDGTLLPMNQEEFTECYFKNITKAVAVAGYNPEELVKSIWSGTKAMVMNNGGRPNEQAFWDRAREIYGDKIIADKPLFDRFYDEEFDNIRPSCGFSEKARLAVEAAKKTGAKVILATNPIFPATATKRRIAWAGLELADFELFTTYENSSFCKPNPKYYQEICEKIACEPQECVMIGNDVDEDMIAEKLGFKVFLITDCLINKSKVDISRYPNGGFDDMIAFIKCFG